MEDCYTLIAILIVLAAVLVITLSKASKCKQMDGYPGPGKCIGPGPAMGGSEPCCDPSNDLYNDEKNQICDYDGWGFKYGNMCIGYGRNPRDCIDNCMGDSDCIKKCPTDYSTLIPAGKCLNPL